MAEQKRILHNYFDKSLIYFIFNVRLISLSLYLSIYLL